MEANEEKIQETIYKSKNAFFMAEQERMLSYHDFLWTQLRVIQKRWWVLQFMILVALWIALSSIPSREVPSTVSLLFANDTLQVEVQFAMYQKFLLILVLENNKE